MFIDKDSIVIDNINMGQYLVEAKFSYNKLWANAGRNLAGTQTGTLIGIFPKLVLQFGPLTKDQLETIIPILDKATQSTTYYDPNKKTNITMQTYTGDYEIVNKKIINAYNKNEGFSVSFISRSKRV